jgi:hypothetical protein
MFRRTDSGLVAKYLFHKEPIVWVEGHTDIPFYRWILRNRPCRIEAAGGKQECLVLAKAIVENDYPYVVVIDGDYDILERKRSFHRRVILLHRYSMENYLFERNPIRQVCCNYACVDAKQILEDGTFEELLETLETELKDLVVLDVAHNRADTGIQALPNNPESLIESRKHLLWSRDRIEQLYTQFLNDIDEKYIDEAAALVREFLENARFVDLLRGHFVFGILRDLIINTVRSQTGNKPNVDNEGLIVLLSAEVWSATPSSDHQSLKRRLYRAIKEIQEMK